MAPTSTKQRRAIGIVRVSQVNGREGDSFASPAEQRDRIEAACERDGLTLLRIEDEANVSGGQVERLIAREALASVGIRRLMTVPGVNVIVAASFMAAIGDIHRFGNPRKLVGYLGLDPRVRQSGSGPASHGRISKQGSVRARHALVESCWSAVRQPGPLHAFYQRVRARRGHSVAIVAAARKLACLFWVLLTREEDYAYAQPSLTRKKLRQLEITAGAKRYAPEGAGIWHANEAVRQAERELAAQAEVAYTRTVRDYHATQAIKPGAGATRIVRPSKRQAPRQGHSPRPCALARRRPRPSPTLPGAPHKSKRP